MAKPAWRRASGEMGGLIWDNVTFDHAAVSEAAGVLERGAAQFDQASMSAV